MAILLFGIVVYLGFGLYLYLIQHSLIYFPVQATSCDNEETIVENDGYQIKATVLNKGKNKALIYFGGNAENVDDHLEKFSTLFSAHTIYLIKYRGYGGSSGKPTEAGIYSDVLAIYDMVGEKHETISIIGRSLGTAVATYLASQRMVHKLALITPFDSLQNVAQSRFPIYPMGILLKDKYDSFARASSVKAKTLVIAAEKDNVIKMSRTKRLLQGFSEEVEFHVIEGVDHHNISDDPSYLRILTAFI